MACTYHVLRYTPNLVRDEGVNIGILLFNSATGERRLRLIERRRGMPQGAPFASPGG